jgi:lipid-binding SYLF domain-containing protein
VDSTNTGLDGVIPRTILENARGFAIFTIFKAGFVFSARAGSGIVIAKLDDGSESTGDPNLQDLRIMEPQHGLLPAR